MNKAISFNGGKESLIVLHKYMKETDIIFNVEDKHDFPEIVKYVSYICNYYKIKLLTFKDAEELVIAFDRAVKLAQEGNTILEIYNLLTK